MSRYYVAKRPDSWLGVCEVPDGQTEIFYHHMNWPELARHTSSFTVSSFPQCIDPQTGWWVPLVDEDLLMDIGL